HLPVVRRDDQARERPVPVTLRHWKNGAKAKKGRDLGAVTVGVESPEPIGIIGRERAGDPDEQRTRPVMARVVGPGGIDRRAVWRYAKDLGPNIVTAGEDGPVRRDRQRTQRLSQAGERRRRAVVRHFHEVATVRCNQRTTWSRRQY